MKKTFNTSIKKKKYLIYGVISIIIVSCLSIMYLKYQQLSTATDIKIQDNTSAENFNKIAYIAKEDIKKGSYINESNFSIAEANETLESDLISDIKAIENTPLQKDIKTGETLTMSFFIEPVPEIKVEDNERFIEHKFMDGAIPSVLPNGSNIIGSIVDIMVFKPNAKDETVVSKATVITSNGNNLGFYLDPEERESLKEAALESGGFYIITYLNDTQEKSTVTYKPEYMKGVN